MSHCPLPPTMLCSALPHKLAKSLLLILGIINPLFWRPGFLHCLRFWTYSKSQSITPWAFERRVTISGTLVHRGARSSSLRSVYKLRSGIFCSSSVTENHRLGSLGGWVIAEHCYTEKWQLTVEPNPATTQRLKTGPTQIHCCIRAQWRRRIEGAPREHPSSAPQFTS